MRRTLPALWTPLLALLLAGALVRSSPAPKLEASAGRADISAGPAKAVLPAPLLQRALHFRSPADRQGVSPGVFLAAENPGRVTPHRAVAAPAAQVGAPQSDTARHYPLLPTGPPSHS